MSNNLTKMLQLLKDNNIDYFSIKHIDGSTKYFLGAEDTAKMQYIEYSEGKKTEPTFLFEDWVKFLGNFTEIKPAYDPEAVILQIDNSYETTLAHFIQENNNGDVEPLADSELKALLSMEVGEEIYMGVMISIKRIK